MISFSTFKLIKEELTPEQKRQVDDWNTTDTAKKISGHLPFNSEGRLFIDLKSRDEEPHPEVTDHLKKHGYEITDYKSGLAKKVGEKNSIKIGKILERTSAPDHVKQRFVNDPARSGSRNDSGLEVAISRHPYDIGGCTSGRSWEDDSCLRLPGNGKGGGMYYQKVKDELREGSHVAYLIHKGDHDIQKPLARIMLRPFTTDGGHTILRPEGRQYGQSTGDFTHTVSKWAEDKFPGHANTVYMKNLHVYNDDNNNYAVGPVTEPRVLTKLPHDILEHVAKNITLNDSIFFHFANHPNPEIRNKLARNRTLQSHHIDHIFANEDDDGIKMTVLRNPNATAKHVDHVIEEAGKFPQYSPYQQYVMTSVAAKPNLSKEHIAKVWDYFDNRDKFDPAYKPNTTHHDYLTRQRNLTSDQIDYYLNNNDRYHLINVAENAKLTSDHITKLIDKDEEFHDLGNSGLNFSTYKKLVNQKNFNQSHVNKILTDDTKSYMWQAKAGLASRRDLTNDNIHRLIKVGDEEVHTQLMQHPNLQSEHVKAMIDDHFNMGGDYADSHVKKLINHPALNTKDQEELLNSDDYYKIMALAGKNDLHPSIIDKFVNSDNDEIRESIESHPQLTSKHISHLLKMRYHNEGGPYATLTRHPNFTESHIHEMLQHIKNTPNSEMGKKRSGIYEFHRALPEPLHTQYYNSFFHKDLLGHDNF